MEATIITHRHLRSAGGPAPLEMLRGCDEVSAAAVVP